MNECQFSEKDWLKAKASPTILHELSEKYQLLSMPFINTTVTALAELGLKQTQAKRCKNFFVLGSLVWLLELSIDKVNR